MGGGIRTLENIKEVLDLGVYRVIIGTKAVENPDFIRQAIEKFGPEHIVVGVDAKDGLVAIEGWENVSDKTALSLALAMKDMGVQTIVYTDISKDGMLSGPNVEQTKLLSDKTGINIIASGGMSCVQDLKNINDAGIHGAIIGKAIYENRINLKDAVSMFESGASVAEAGRKMSTSLSFKLGHPVGASGCRIFVTLLHEMQKRDAKKGLATLCIGGGMGCTTIVERD